ncbi:histidine kinase dimerization/phosphoacceptor domain-containing protein [Streptomyces sp. M10(2022)]
MNQASGTVHAVGSLLAVSLLVGVVRRMPLLALAMTLFGSTAMVVVSPASFRDHLSVSYQGEFLSYLAVDLVLGFTVATRTRRTSVVAVAVSFVVQLLAIGTFAHGDNLTVNGVIMLLAMAASCMVGLLSRERREHAVALRSQEVAEAVTSERLRIARELHDMVAHSIGIIAIQAGMGSRVIQTQPAEARDALRAIEATSRETLSAFGARWWRSVGPTRTHRPRNRHRWRPRRVWRTSKGWWRRSRTRGTRRRVPQRGAAFPAGRHRPVRLPDRAGVADQRGPPRGHRTLPGGHRVRGGGTVRGGRR